MAGRLRTRCDHSHEHQHLLGGRAADAAFYRLRLITEIRRGIRDTKDAAEKHDHDHTLLDASIGSFHDMSTSIAFAVQQEDHKASSGPRTAMFKMADGTSRKLNLSDSFKPRYKDECTLEQIPSSWVEEAIQGDVDYFNGGVCVARRPT